MKTLKLSQILFSLAVIAALALAVFPVGAAHALAANATSATALTPGHVDGAALNSVVCRTIHFTRNGHRITIRICHRVKPAAS